MLKLKENMSAKEISIALETARLMGFFSETAEFPVAGLKGNIPLPQSLAQLEEMWKKAEDKAENVICTPNPDVLFDTDFRLKKGLETVFSQGALLKDRDHDFFPDTMDVKIRLNSNADVSAVISACNIAFRLGMETVAYEDGIVADEHYSGNVIEFVDSEKVNMTWQENEGTVKVTVYGRGSDLEKFTAAVCEKFPVTDIWRRWRDILCSMTDSFAMKNSDGQLAYLAAEGENRKGCTAFVSPETAQEQKDCFRNVEFKNYKSGRAVYHKEYDIPWEVETFNCILENKLYPLLKTGDRVEVYAALSEEQSVRENITAQIIKKTALSQAVVDKIQVVDAYKQGLSWIKEFVLPQIKDKNIEKTEIYFKPFLPQGQAQWLDENGATPNKVRTLDATPDKWFDLPIRYLQELYPVEDIIVKELGIHRDNVEFKVYEGNADITYICKAYCAEKEVYCESYKASYSERPFIDEYPQLGMVHPSTGYLKVIVNGNIAVDERIKTDLESVWDIYQSQVLPDCKRYVEQKYGDDISAQKQPFFQKLHLDITLSETEYFTGSRQDMVSPLNALHEDLYFTGTDYFKYYGQAKGCLPFDAPGLILPDIHKGEGKPKFEVILYDLLREIPTIEKDGKVLAQQRSREGINLWISALSMTSENLSVTIRAEGVPDKVLQAYAMLYSQGVLSLSGEIENTAEIQFVSDSGNVYTAKCLPVQKLIKSKKITDINIYEDKVIGYDEYIEVINELKQVEGIEVFHAATSYEGRKIYAIWLKKPHKGYLSMTKYLTNRPSEYINARHHANEVSSTNGAFMLIRKLLTDKKYADCADKMSLVIIPVENVDGTAIHYELQKEHPNWKHHTARFNAIGKEFCGECYTADPVSTEALAASRIYRRFVPDIMVDNHGVPSHEWEQQFSGYTSPAYKGFWLPRSLLYGYFWYAKEQEYAYNIPLNKKMEDVIADAIAIDDEMRELNREWAQQFEKYAHAWMPKLFPASYYKGMINYWIPFPQNPKHIYAAVRYPWVTGVAYTSEVADETAQGEYLTLCAKAHLAHDIATVDMILAAQHNFACKVQTEGEIKAQYRRIRPMKV